MNLIFFPQKNNPIIYKGIEAIKKLEMLGLTFEDFDTAAKKAYRECQDLPPYAYSLDKHNRFFYAFIKHFRARMLEKGWKYNDKYNLNRTMPSNKKYTIIFSSGDKNVCSLEQTPATKNKKGEISKVIITMNNYLQLSFYEDLRKTSPDIPERYDIAKIPHWFCLFKRAGEKNQIELSLPLSMNNKNKKIEEWSERIILPEIDCGNIGSEQYSKPDQPDPSNLSTADKEKIINITKKK